MSPKAPASGIALLALTLILLAGPGLAAPPTIVKEADLEFGRFAASPSFTTRVSVSTDGSRSTDHGLLLPGASPQPAQFSVSGPPNGPFQASISVGGSGPAGVTLEGLTATCGAGSTYSGAILSGCQLSVSGTGTIHVGGSLAVDAGQGRTSVSMNNAITVQVSN